MRRFTLSAFVSIVLIFGTTIKAQAQVQWDDFNIPITYSSNETPDTIIVIFASSANYDFTDINTLMRCKGQDGSTLWIDDVSYEYETSDENKIVFDDGGFENCWQQYTAGAKGNAKYMDFKSTYFLGSLNLLYDMTEDMGIAPLTTYQEEDAAEGNYALRLVSKPMTFGGESLFLPGAVGALRVDVGNVNCYVGMPFTGRPIALKGQFCYKGEKGDSAAIEIVLKKNGNVIGHGKEVYYSESGISEKSESSTDFSIFPNPSCESIRVNFEKETTGEIIVYDNMGRFVSMYPVDGEIDVTINLKNYAAGTYLINLMENNKVLASKRFVKQ